jgi:PTH1 family peptidyl-tRNA hydrolase
MKVIVGLGNPGSQYALTRHNAGFMAVDRLAERHDISGGRTRFRSTMCEGPVCGEKCVLLRPQTYMNRSGLAVGEAVAFYKIDPASELLIIVDDVALPCGRLRLRAAGSAGGHNGLIDIERALGGDEYPRLRIGIDAPAPGGITQKDYVLGRFTPDQLEIVQSVLKSACDAIDCWISDSLEHAMSRYNPADARPCDS